MTLFYKTCAPHMVLNFSKSPFSVKSDLKISRLSEWGSAKKVQKQNQRVFLNVPSFTPGISNPCSSKGLHGFLFYKQLSWNCGKLSETESDTMELGGVGSDKGWRTQRSIGHRNVLENQRIQQAFSQTALLLYFCRPSLFRAAEILFLAGKQRKNRKCFSFVAFAGDYRMVQARAASQYECQEVWVMCIVLFRNTII